jgi:localization factor PodJL
MSLEPQIRDDAPAPKSDQPSFLARNRRAILLAALVVAVGLLAANLMLQRMQPAPAAEPAPITTGDIADDVLLPMDAAPILGENPDAPGPRVIDMGPDSVATGAINRKATQAFAPGPLQSMPSAFGAADDLAKAATPDVTPLAPTTPVKFDLPAEGIGPVELRQAAADGDVRAQFEVAAILTEGRAVPQDYAAAAIWYERAGAAGFVPAQYRLGSLYENGNGVEKDLEKAKLWYERAAEGGNRMAMHNLAALYAGGQLGKQEFDLAAKWFEEAAARGMTDSQFNLGMLYARGLGVPQSLEDSFKWFGIAAKSGDADASKARDDVARSLDAETMTRLTDIVNNFQPTPIDLTANFAPIGTWSNAFDPGESIASRDIVASVQKALGKLGYDVGTPDGIAGAKTQSAIKQFEQATGMSAVGQINPRLLAVLGSQPV